MEGNLVMQMDMHFYGIYALARTAGVNPETARTIAYASQFVDDAIEDKPLILRNQKIAVLPTLTSHKPLDYQNRLEEDQWKVWVCFHFLPGNDPEATCFEERMICKKNSAPARAILDNALKHKREPFGPHLAGIVAHVFADTYAHYGFIGLTSDWNKVKGRTIKLTVISEEIKDYVKGKVKRFMDKLAGVAAENVLSLGHAAVATLPDRPFLEWAYEYEEGNRASVVRKNCEDYMEAAKEFHDFFSQLLEGNPNWGSLEKAKKWKDIEENIRSIIKMEGRLEERIELWKSHIISGELFQTEIQDLTINYNEQEWNLRHGIEGYSQFGFQCNACLYIKAAQNHQTYVLTDLLPRLGVLA